MTEYYKKQKPAKPAKITAKSNSKVENLDWLTHPVDAIDDPEADAEFSAAIAEILKSDSRMRLDPRLDHRDLPLAVNSHQWLTGRNFMSIKPFARQLEIMGKLHLDWCPKCSPEAYYEPIDFRWKPSEFPAQYQYFKNGVCPACNYDRYRAVKYKHLHDKFLHIGIAGQRCVTANTVITTEHGLRRIGTMIEPNKQPDGFAETDVSYPSLIVPTGEGLETVRPSHTFYHRIDDVYRVTLANGMSVEGTPDHPLLTEHGMVKVKDLVPGEPKYKVLTVYGADRWPKSSGMPYTVYALSIIRMLYGNDLRSVRLTLLDDVQVVMCKNYGIKPSKAVDSLHERSYSLLLEDDVKFARITDHRILAISRSDMQHICMDLLGAQSYVPKSDPSDLVHLLANAGIVCSFSKTKRGYKLVIPASSRKQMQEFIKNGVVSQYYEKAVQVTGKIYIGRQPVYDFTVPEHHKFIANSMINSNSSKCLHGDAMVRTPDGPVPIGLMVKEGKGYTARLSRGDAPISHYWQKGTDQTYKLITDYGVPIVANASHLFYVEGRGYVQMRIGSRLKDQLAAKRKLKAERKGRKPETVREPEKDERLGIGGYLRVMPSEPIVRSTALANDKTEVARQWAGEDFRAGKRIRPEIYSKRYQLRWHYFAELIRLATIPDHCILLKESFEAPVREWMEQHGVANARLSVQNGYVTVKVNARQLQRSGIAGANKWWQPLEVAPGMHHQLFKNPQVPELLRLTVRDEIRRVLDKLASIEFFLTDEGRKDAAAYTYSFWSILSSHVPNYSLFIHFMQSMRLFRKAILTALSSFEPNVPRRAWYDTLQKDLYDCMVNVRSLRTRRYVQVVDIQDMGKANVYDITVPSTSWFIANGLHVHNSVTVGQNIAYAAHRLIKTGDAGAYYSLLPGTELTAVLTATTAANALRNVYTPLRSILDDSPWFRMFKSWCDERGQALGVELYKVMDTYALFRFGGLSIRVFSPDRRRIRGSTAFGAATDELGHFDSDEDKVRAGGLEVFSALGIALQNAIGGARQLRREGDIDVVFPVNHAISSIFSKSDPIMTLQDQYKNNPSVLTYTIPTWKFNPNLSIEDLRSTVLASNFDRDIGCIATSSSGSFITDLQHLEVCLTTKPNAADIEGYEFKAKKSNQRFTTGRVTFRKKRRYQGSTLMTLDAGYNNNQYAVCISHIDYDNQGEKILVIDALGCVHPSTKAPIHYTKMADNVLIPMADEFNVGALISDRWQTLQIQQDMMDEKEMMADTLTLKKDDFLQFREAVYARQIRLPDCEVGLDEVLTLNSVDDFTDIHVAHFLRQAVTVIEKPKTVDKGKVFSDDLFRVVVLAHAASRINDIADCMVETEDDEDPPETALLEMATVSRRAKDVGDIDSMLMLSASNRSRMKDNDDEETGTTIAKVSNSRR